MRNGDRPPRQILGIRQVVAKIGQCKTTIYTDLLPKRGFPAPIRIGRQRLGWFEDEIDEWLDKQPRRLAPGVSLSPSADDLQVS
jgi:predicted DNA-binding transcriptional regulator AlpA